MGIDTDICIDQEALATAVAELRGLETDVRALQSQLSEQLQALEVGFRTPAGQAFFATCNTKFTKPLADQLLVLGEMISNLENATTQYLPVFEKYKQLNAAIDNHPD